MKFAKFFLVLLFPLCCLAEQPHISDVLEGKAKASDPKALLKRKINPASKAKQTYNESTRLKIARAKKEYPEIEKLYDSTLSHAERLKGEEGGVNGTNLALERVCLEFEKQFMSLMWQYAAGGVGSGDSFAGDMWNSQWHQAVVESGSERGEIAEVCVEDLSRVSPNQKNNRGK